MSGNKLQQHPVIQEPRDARDKPRDGGDSNNSKDGKDNKNSKPDAKNVKGAPRSLSVATFCPKLGARKVRRARFLTNGRGCPNRADAGAVVRRST